MSRCAAAEAIFECSTRCVAPRVHVVCCVAQSNRYVGVGVKDVARPPLSEAQWHALERALAHPWLHTLCVATETAPITHSPAILGARVSACAACPFLCLWHVYLVFQRRRPTYMSCWEQYPMDAVRLYRMLWEWKLAAKGRYALDSWIWDACAYSCCSCCVFQVARNSFAGRLSSSPALFRVVFPLSCADAGRMLLVVFVNLLLGR